MTLDLADRAARERIATDLDASLFVEAGAGTGKTRALVDRVVALVASGRLASVERLAAITFTEAAAAEMRDRIRHSLIAATNDAARESAARERCRRAASEVELAAIQTAHAFAGSLLRSAPIEAGLPPGFAIVDEIELGLDLQHGFLRWFSDIDPSDSGGASPALRRLLALGASPDHIGRLARALSGQIDLLASGRRWRGATVDVVSAARDIGRRLADLTSDDTLRACSDQGDTMCRHLIGQRSSADRLRTVAGEPEAVDALKAVRGGAARLGVQRKWRSGTLEAVRDRWKELAELSAAARAAVDRAAFADVLALVAEFTRAQAGQRQKDGSASFDDLLWRARDLLRDDLGVRQSARARFSHVFVDEFQDTDPLQAEIVWYLAADNPASREPWDSLRPAPGRLFVVGDPKQSIYRFRRADLGVYHRAKATFDAGDCLSLTVSFRSVPRVLEWFNAFFPRHMDESVGVQPRYESLAAHAEDDGGGPRVLITGQQFDGNAGEAWRREANAVAEITTRAVTEPWRVRLTGKGSAATRPARWSDICILLPARTNLNRIERALDGRGVPYRVEGGSLIFQTTPARELTACLRSINDPSDQVALIAAMTSSAYGCSDVDLLAWADARRAFDYTVDRRESGDDERLTRVGAAMASLRQLRARRGARSVAATIDALIDERLLAVAAFDEMRPVETLRRYRYVAAIARRLDSAGRPDLGAFVNWLDDVEAGGFRLAGDAGPIDGDPIEGEGDDDVVRLMTVHGAKGLEFPIAIVTGLGGTQRADDARVVVDRARGTVEASLGVRDREFATEGFADAKDSEKAHAEAERIRLLYVATTRARDWLVLSLWQRKLSARTWGGDTRQPTLGERIAMMVDDGGFPFGRLSEDGAPEARAGVTDAPLSPLSPEAHRELEADWSRRRAEAIARAGRPAATTATRLSAHGHAGSKGAVPETRADAPFASAPLDDWHDLADGADDRPDPRPPRLGRAATEIGQAVHLALQLIDLADGANREAAIARAIDQHGVSSHRDEIRRLVDAAWRSDIVRRAAVAPRHWREVPIGVVEGGMAIEGRIDLLFENTDGGIEIVDFKTDRVSETEVQARTKEYHVQAGIYALAVERATGRKPSAVSFVFASLPGTVVRVTDLAPLHAAVRTALLEEGGQGAAGQ